MPDKPLPLNIRFGPFLLEEADARLSREGLAIDIVPKAFGVLCHLAARPGRLVTKDELLDAVWGRRFVSDSVLKSAVRTIRICLADEAQAPRYVETVNRRGYRFIASAQPVLPAPGPVPGAPRQAVAGPLIGRANEMASLTRAWQQASAGQRRLVLLAGEPGIGKSCLADHFAASLGAGALVGRGQCVDQVGSDAAYLPILEALNPWCAEDPGLLALLRQVAPTWLLQMPWHLPPPERSALQHELAGSGSERMLREMAELLDRLAALRPLLLVLEDLHWADAATLRLLDLLARRRSSARIMVLATYRPNDALPAEHPLADLRHELRLQGLCDEIGLRGFDRPAIEACLSLRLSSPGPLGSAAIDAALVASLHRHTDGQPLFLARVVDELLAGEALANVSGRWTLRNAHDAALPVPPLLVELIERQALRLAPAERDLLQAAALCPTGFDAAQLAEALQIPADAAAECLAGLARKALWIRAGAGGMRGARVVGVGVDAGVEAPLTFSHALFRHVLRAQLPAARRIDLHRRLGAALEAAHRGRLAGVAAELGLHAEAGRQPERAAGFLSLAAGQALRRFAPRHALALAERAMALLDTTSPADPTELASTLHSQRLLALVATNGYASAPTLSAAREAEALIDAAPLRAPALPLWYGCAWIEIYTGHAARALQLAQSLAERAAQALPGVGEALALTLMGVVAYHGNRFIDSRELLERAVQMLDEAPAGFEAAYFPQNPLLEALAHLSHVQELRGDVDAAAQSRARLTGMVNSGLHPLSELMGLWFLAYAHQLRDEPAQTVQLCERALRAMSTHDVNPAKGMHLSLLAWACGRSGDRAGAAESARAALFEHALQRTRMGNSTLLTCVAGAFMTAGEWTQARSQLDEAMQAARDTDNCFGVTETLRLRAELHGLEDRDAAGAQADLERAIEMATAQGALLFERRARESRDRLRTGRPS